MKTLEQCINEIISRENIQAALSEYVNRLTATGLRQEIAVPYVIASYLSLCRTGKYPEIESGYRRPKKQIQLINRWNAGDRSGLAAKPAVSSWHMQGLALDVVPLRGVAWTDFVGYMIAFGCRWGGNFKTPDRVHFDFPIGEPQTASQLVAKGGYLA